MRSCLNPYRPLPELYNEAVRKKCRGADLYDPHLEPHLYHAAEKAFRELQGTRKSQSMVISGESGAGGHRIRVLPSSPGCPRVPASPRGCH